MTDKRLRVSWPGGLKLRTQPEPTDASYTGITVAHGTIVDAIGELHQYDDLFTFQQVRTPDGRKGWLTYQAGDTTYLTPVAPTSHREPQPVEGKKLRVNWAPGLRMRTEPEPSWTSTTGVIVPDDTVVVAIGEPSPHPEGYVFQKVHTPQGEVGWLTLSDGDTVYLADVVEVEDTKVDEGTRPEPDTDANDMWVDWFDGLRLRERPESSLDSFTGIVVPYRAKVVRLGSPVDDPEGYTFQKVRLSDGETGWLTASYGSTVYLSEEEPEAKPVPIAQVNLAAGLWAKMRGSPDGAVEWWVGGAVPLRTVDPDTAGARIGKAGQWIEVETPALKRGFIGAEHVKPFTPSKHKAPLRRGESPYIYGVHDGYDRKVLTSAGVTGWVLFTEAIGTDLGTGGNRKLYYEWESEGFGILSRLNHGYGSGGTIPEPHKYDDFVRTCAAFVERSIDPDDPEGGCHIWIIANEMNNPREYPGNHDGVGGHPITPERYADCFNRVYRAIKKVYQKMPGLSPSDGMVVPGAIDPYNAVAGCNGDWFTRMLANIEALDGIALHAYTHGTDPGLVTSRKTFGDEHNPPKRFPDKSLSWQYYNFYAYRTFMELIPTKWRHVPVFITETDQVQKNWANANTGWVQNMYAELNRWNSDPNHQRIYCSLLFRWAAFDGWQIRDKGGVLDDLKQAAQKKYKWQG